MLACKRRGVLGGDAKRKNRQGATILKGDSGSVTGRTGEEVTRKIKSS